MAEGPNRARYTVILDLADFSCLYVIGNWGLGVGLELEIRQVTQNEGLSLAEVIFSGSYVQGDPVVFGELRAKLEDLLRIHDPAAVLMNLLGVEEILRDDLSAIASAAIGLDRPRGPRLCAIAVKQRALVNIDSSLVHQFKMPGVLMCGADRDLNLWHLGERLADMAAELQGQKPVYFPDMTLDETRLLHESLENWFSRHLWRMQEPSLADLSRNPDYHVYRFLWLRTFDEPVSVRLEIDPAGTCTLISKKTSGQGGYFTGRLVVNESRNLPRQTVSTFLEHLKKANFWYAEVVCDGGLDGAEWILEGAKGGSYHVARQWSPREGPFREAALFLLELSGMKVGEIY
jgi:hypothetical protein